MPCRVQDGTSYGGDYEAQMDVAQRKADAASNCRFRFLINAVVGSVIVMFAALAVILFAVIPYSTQAKPQKTLWADGRKHRYEWPPPSNSLMGKFTKAAVTCDHGLCSEIGRDILIRGGNAVDASIASLFCLGITNPQSSGIGGGFIMTLYNKTTEKCTVIDARETAPKASTRDMFGSDEWASKYGWRAIATPGEIAGYWLAFQQFGSGRLTWKELVQPSIELARNGVPVSEYLGYVLGVKEKHFRTLPTMQGWINNKTDHVYQNGDIIYRRQLADTLEEIANSEDPVHLFYHGKFADIIVKEIQENGGLLTKEDLASYKPVVYDTPLQNHGFYGNLTMCGPPPPSSFSVAQSIVAVMLSQCDKYVEDYGINAIYSDPFFYHSLIEAQKFAYAQRTHLGDVDFVPEAYELAKNMTTAEYTAAVLDRFVWKAMPSAYYGNNITAQAQDHGTSHVSAIDPEGNGVSATSTVNRWFGAVVQSPTLGIVWNDEMDDFSTPGMANGFGFAPSQSNFIEPGKRPMSSMSPMIIYDNVTGKLKMVIGASGGSKIISAMAKPIIRVLCFNETIKQAIDAPTLHNQYTPDITQYEDAVPKELIKDLEMNFNQTFKYTTGFEGIVQGIVVEEDGFIYANGDYRRKSNMHPEGF
ncbi:Protein H14N18.4 a [Aphelenchoides avenae]|nr:Protein H14N18.4 a [Aphelenchus avenae]